MFEKKEFKVCATSLSSEIISLFSTNVICSLETILSERKGFTVFQNVLMSHTFSSCKLPKYSFFSSSAQVPLSAQPKAFVFK